MTGKINAIKSIVEFIRNFKSCVSQAWRAIKVEEENMSDRHIKLLNTTIDALKAESRAHDNSTLDKLDFIQQQMQEIEVLIKVKPTKSENKAKDTKEGN